MVDLNELCNRMDLRHFVEREIAFLKEYCIALKPLAMGLDILQGEENCYYGILLPTLETILKKTLSVKPELSNMTTGACGLHSGVNQNPFQTSF